MRRLSHIQGVELQNLLELRSGERMNKTLHGTICGRTIQLDEDPGIVAGQEVEVMVKVVTTSHNWGDGIRRSAGGWVNHPELDETLEAIHSERKLERKPTPGLE